MFSKIGDKRGILQIGSIFEIKGIVDRNTLKNIIITAAIILGFLLQACIYVVPDAGKKNTDSVSVNTMDSSRAYGPVDTTARDSMVVVIDTVKTDSAMLPNSVIHTRNVLPQQVVDFAKTLIGIPYKYASTDPAQGFDCSGFITYVFKHFNILVPRSSIDFTNVGRTIPPDSARAGDLILFTGTDSTEKFVGHMGLVVSNENKELNFIHSTSGKKYGVTITPFNGYYHSRFMKTIRIFPQNETVRN